MGSVTKRLVAVTMATSASEWEASSAGVFAWMMGRSLLGHEGAVPLVELLARAAGQGAELEGEVLVDVQRPARVVAEERGVAALVVPALEDAPLDEVLGPVEVAVAVEQRVVEVEEGELHVSSGCSAALRSGTVIGRPVSRE